MKGSPFKSQAQHDLMRRVANDSAYAAERGISQDVARDLLKQHADAGAPTLELASRRGALKRDGRSPLPPLKGLLA